MLAAIRRANVLYLVAAALFVATLAVTAFASPGDKTGLSRTGSVLDESPGGSAVLRRWLEALGTRTVVLQGDRYAPDADVAPVLLVLGASEPFTPADVAALREYVRSGGVLVVATELGLAEAPLLGVWDVRVAGLAPLGQHVTLGPGAAIYGARSVSIDQGRTLDLGTRGISVARTQSGSLAGVVREGSGAVYVVGSLAPFLSGQIAEGDNSRFVLSLVDSALRSGAAVGFDEYHHGVHPAPDVLAILERTWPGRALLISGALLFAYVLLTGRRLGPPLPLEHRPARSSLDHVRAFAGLVRRSGHSEIVRERLRHDLRVGIARETGLDPRSAPERLFTALAQVSAARAADAREVDTLLARRSPPAELLRIVRRVDGILHPERESS